MFPGDNLVAFSHVKLRKDQNSCDLSSIVSPFSDPTPYMLPVEEVIPLETSPNVNTIKNEGVVQVSTLSDDDIDMEAVESKLSELSSLLEAYPPPGGNINTNLSGNMMNSQVSTTSIGDCIYQDIVDSFLNFPEDSEFPDHNHDELLNSWMLDAAVPDSYSYLHDTVAFSSGLDLSTNYSSQTLYPCNSGIVSSVGSSLPLPCIIIPATDSVNGNVETMMESLCSSDQNDKSTNKTQHQRGQKASSLASNKRRSRAKPGGGNNHKSRPRDRQRIQDRVKELRVLVPNGGKCSIDGLLDKTVKHMLYLTSVTDQAQLLKMWVNQGQKVKQRTSLDFKCFGGEQKECPIHVEDLAHPGHLLIEVLCNERILFLEIARVIRSLELNILKGVIMQSRDNNNTWAHFVVEASRGFQRLDIFWPLMQLLHRTRNPECWLTLKNENA